MTRPIYACPSRSTVASPSSVASATAPSPRKSTCPTTTVGRPIPGRSTAGPPRPTTKTKTISPTNRSTTGTHSRPGSAGCPTAGNRALAAIATTPPSEVRRCYPRTL
ncbi:hypothetical protein BDW42DRAFT_162456 [Aspergillus taichungensis]|uniref:Uncharacterized protein n=1 Tax=Aspergillus taichungensis TaxID=482145 RepID=A0A2J5I3G3_9EURO|nr:hypothetical protein BDW42DRAFT_162456 [Aspergillus taichungensis]